MTNSDSARATTDEAELDRLVERSLAASARTGAPPPAPGRSSAFGWITAAILGALLIGTLASPLAERQLRALLPESLQDQPAAPALAPPAGTDPALGERVGVIEASLKALAESNREQGGIDATVAERAEARIAEIEATLIRNAADRTALDQRLDGLAQSIAALAGSGQARIQRVEELLLLDVARKLMQAGRPLGPLIAPLEGRPALAEPDAVAALKDWSASPVTRQTLASRLQQVPAQKPAGDGWWQRMNARLGGLFEVRAASNAQDTAAQDAALRALSGNELDRAIAAMAGHSQNPQTAAWLADARRLAAAESALDRLDQLLLATMLGDFAATPPPATADNSAAVQQKSSTRP